MSRRAVPFLALLLLAAVVSSGGESRTLKGTYVWGPQGKARDLEAVFSPTAPEEWEVAFHFTLQGAQHVYRGTARGSLSDGPLEGKVQNEGKDRTFTFSGTSAGGRFRGIHAEVTDGSEEPGGTLTLGG